MTIPAGDNKPYMKKNNRITRRKLLNDSLLMGMAGTMAPWQLVASTSQQLGKPKKGLIEKENNKVGSTNWKLTYVRFNKYRSEIIESYSSSTRGSAGGILDVFVNTGHPSEVSINTYRIGYYGGKVGRHVNSLEPISEESQSTHPVGEHRLRECKWKSTIAVAIPGAWISVAYLGGLYFREHQYESYIFFAIRDNRKADFLVQTCDNFWQAYNLGSDDYRRYGRDPPQPSWSSTNWIICDLPYGWYLQVVDQSLLQGSGDFLLLEYSFCYWVEKHGCDVTCYSNVDNHINDAKLGKVKCFISVGHAKYWSKEMSKNIQAVIKGGLRVGFLAGDTVTAVIIPSNELNRERRPHLIIHRMGMLDWILAEDRKVYEQMSSGWGYDLLHKNLEKQDPS